VHGCAHDSRRESPPHHDIFPAPVSGRQQLKALKMKPMNWLRIRASSSSLRRWARENAIEVDAIFARPL